MENLAQTVGTPTNHVDIYSDVSHVKTGLFDKGSHTELSDSGKRYVLVMQKSEIALERISREGIKATRQRINS